MRPVKVALYRYVICNISIALYTFNCINAFKGYVVVARVLLRYCGTGDEMKKYQIAFRTLDNSATHFYKVSDFFFQSEFIRFTDDKTKCIKWLPSDRCTVEELPEVSQ